MILPLPLAGEGWGEGGLQIYPPHLILSPRGEEIRRCAVLKCKVCTFKKLLTGIFGSKPIEMKAYSHI
jgi:hypothetical protein